MRSVLRQVRVGDGPHGQRIGFPHAQYDLDRISDLTPTDGLVVVGFGRAEWSRSGRISVIAIVALGPC
jgi:hypothetical protein